MRVGVSARVGALLFAVALVSFWESSAAAQARVETPLNAVAFSGAPCTEQARGSVIRGEIRLERSSAGVPAVGVSETVSGGTGQQWSTALWLAAFNASQAAGASITDWEFFVRADGLIDGPSAGMLLTAKYIALLKGDRIDPVATMTGTINPDGSAGPVGGIPQKMEAAAAAGMRRFGYPVGARMSMDLRTCKDVDLEQWGASLGLETREIRDFRDAYEFFTGKRLPQGAPAGSRDMDFTTAEQDAYRQNISDLANRIAVSDDAAQKTLESLPADVRAFVNMQWIEEQRAYAIRRLDDAAVFRRAGQVAAETWCMEDALTIVGIIPEYLLLAENLARGNIQGIVTQFNEVEAIAVQDMQAFASVLGELLQADDTVGGRIEFMDYVTYLKTAEWRVVWGATESDHAVQLANRIQAGELSLSNPDHYREFHDSAFHALDAYYRALSMVRIMAGRIRVGGARSAAGRVGEGGRNVRSLARAFAAAGTAELAYFDAVALPGLAQQWGQSLPIAQALLQMQEPAYGVSRHFTATTLQSFQEDGAGGEAQDLVSLATGVDQYVMMALLINRYYSLQTDPNTRRIVNGPALTHQLDFARDRALRAAGASRSRLGFVPSASRRHFQNAAAFREGNDDDKLTALAEYWYATFWSELAVKLSGSGGAVESSVLVDEENVDEGGSSSGVVLLMRVGVPLGGGSKSNFGCDASDPSVCAAQWEDRPLANESSFGIGVDALYGMGSVRVGLGFGLTPTVKGTFESQLLPPDNQGNAFMANELPYEFGTEITGAAIFEFAPAWGAFFLPIRAQAGVLSLAPSGDLADDLDGWCDDPSFNGFECSRIDGPFWGPLVGASAGVGARFGKVGARLEGGVTHSSVKYWTHTVEGGVNHFEWEETLKRTTVGFGLGLEVAL